MMTDWGREVDGECPWPEYPRPQMVRAEWLNLNGWWDFEIGPREGARPADFSKKILVPFAVESALSGVRQAVKPDERMWYRRYFEVEKPVSGGRLLLHFGAVDFEAKVFVNGKLAGEHRGGNTPFWLEITEFVRGERGSRNELVVSAWDPTDTGSQPRGKQTLKPETIWYTAVSGIWQTVWLERVPATFIERVKLTPDVDQGAVRVRVMTRGGEEGLSVEAVPRQGEATLEGAKGKPGEEFSVLLREPIVWSPENPFLYDLTVRLKRGGEVVDEISSYFGLRKVEVKEAGDGFLRIHLNGKPVFNFGVLDQGWWPDGLLTAPTDEALRFDIEAIKRLGMNTCRKHVKIEPARWYYWADKVGLLVWQDMPSGGVRQSHHIAPNSASDAVYSKSEMEEFRRELFEMVDALINSPGIVVWVPFNEGWGQHETNATLEAVRSHDPTRLVDGPSGWEDRGFGDLLDRHSYPGPDMFPLAPGRAGVLGEFGGLGLAVEGHLWGKTENWGYRSMGSKAALQEKYEELVRSLRPLIERGLAAAIYTQLTDVEGEVNGFLTYDRKDLKVDVERVRRLHREIIGR